ncbi:MAG: hypothetical protein V1676_06360 [Candidatus Diapherotrites archaeon]
MPDAGDGEIKLTLLQEETLKEMANVGAARATDTLAKLTNISLEIKVPYIQLLHLEGVFGGLVAPREMLVSLPLNVFGKDRAIICVICKRKAAMHLVDLLFGKQLGHTLKMEEREISAFLEISNIILNSYITEMSEFFKTEFAPSAPRIVLEPESLQEEFRETVDEKTAFALVLGTRFRVMHSETIAAQFTLIVGLKTLDKLKKAIDGKVKEQVIF